MQKKIKSFINASLITEVAFAALGLVFIMFPGLTLDIIRWIIAISALAAGAFIIASDLSREHSFSLFSESIIGTLLVIIGVVFAVNPNVMQIFPVILGAWFVVTSVSACRVTAQLKGTSAYMPSLLAAMLSMLAGIILIINPWAGSEMMMIYVGIVVMVHAISSLIDMIMLKKNLRSVEKKIKNVVKDIKEAEIKNKEEN